MTDLALIISYDVNLPSATGFRGPTAFIQPVSDTSAGVPPELGACRQFGPVFNRVGVVYRVADDVQADEVLRATEQRLRLRHGALRTPVEVDLS